MSSPPFEIALRDGTPVHVRPVEPGDEHLLEVGLDNLSSQSRYFRFLQPVKQLSDKSLARFVDVDQINHIAVGALDLSGSEPAPVGIARSIRLNDAPEKAEVAVAIVDTHQGRGLGTILLAAVAHAAAAQGIKSHVATVLNGNNRMLHLFGELGAKTTSTEAGVLELEIPNHANADDYPATPTGDVFRRIYRML